MTMEAYIVLIKLIVRFIFIIFICNKYHIFYFLFILIMSLIIFLRKYKDIYNANHVLF